MQRRKFLHRALLAGMYAPVSRLYGAVAEAPAPNVEGFCDERFARVRDAFVANFNAGKEIGASFCATVEGETVVDLWGGFTDLERTEPWRADTIVNVFSTTKGAASLVVLLLVDSEEVGLDRPVAEYWPEFAQNGKEEILVRHVMNHTAGLAGFDQPVTMQDLCSHEHMANLIEKQAPWWADRTKAGYHGYTQGFIQGEIVRRLRGKSLGAVFAEAIANPLNADFLIGIPTVADRRVAMLLHTEGQPEPDISDFTSGTNTIGYRASHNPGLDIRWPATEAWRRAEIPSANGHGNARSIANYMRILALGGKVEGRRYLSTQTVDLVHSDPVAGLGLVTESPVNWGLGFQVHPDCPGIIYSGGHGGSLAVANTAARTTCAYAMNRVIHTPPDDGRALSVAAAFDEIAKSISC